MKNDTDYGFLYYRAAQKYADQIGMSHDCIYGYEETEIKRIESLYPFPFPRAYREFLLSVAAMDAFWKRNYNPSQLYESYQSFTSLSVEDEYRAGLKNNSILFYYTTFHGEYEYINIDSGDNPKAMFFAQYDSFSTFNDSLAKRIIRKFIGYTNYYKFGRPFDEKMYFNNGLPYSLNLSYPNENETFFFPE